MAMYDFHCTACEHMFEFERPMGSSVVPPCPQCKSTKTEKQILPPQVIFKGSGFYKTDSAAKNSSAKEPKQESAPKKESVKQPTEQQRKGGSDAKS